jgi:hypothetical protein
MIWIYVEHTNANISVIKCVCRCTFMHTHTYEIRVTPPGIYIICVCVCYVRTYAICMHACDMHACIHQDTCIDTYISKVVTHVHKGYTQKCVRVCACGDCVCVRVYKWMRDGVRASQIHHYVCGSTSVCVCVCVCARARAYAGVPPCKHRLSLLDVFHQVRKLQCVEDNDPARETILFFSKAVGQLERKYRMLR